MKRAMLSLLCGWALASCGSLAPRPVERSETAPGWGRAWDDGSQVEPSREGVVEASPRGVVTPGAAAQHDVQSESGRMYILELYQQAIEEKDDLMEHARALEAERQKLQSMLMEADGRIVDLQAKVDGSLLREEELQGRIDELTGRLLTAQIRRLEAEKLLLEAKIESVREGGIDLAADEGATKKKL